MTILSASTRLLGSRPASAAATRTKTRFAAAFAALLGLVVVYGVGFSPVEAFHNAAHDTRHSNGFPCH